METLLSESLWGDESFSAMAVQRPFWEMIGVVMRDTAPPLFYVLGWLWGRVFGFSEVALRSLSFLLMVGAAGFAALTVWQICKSRFLAVAAGLITIFTPFLVPFAFEWRMYALLCFTVAGSIYFFVARRWLGYIIFTTASLYTHHFALFTVASQGLWFLASEVDWNNRKALVMQLRPFWIVALLYLPWLYPMYLQVVRVRGAGFWLTVPTVSEVVDLLYRFMLGGVGGKWKAVVSILVGILLLGKDWRGIWQRWLEVMVVTLFPVLGAYLVSYFITPIFYDRYLLSVVVGMVVLTVVGVRKLLWPVIVGLIVIYVFSSLTLFFHPGKRPFRDLAAYVISERREGDFLINYNGKAHHLWESKYYGITAPIYAPSGPLPLYVGTAQMTAEDTSAKLPEDSLRLGVITSDPVENIILPSSWERQAVAEFGDLKVVWFSHL